MVDDRLNPFIRLHVFLYKLTDGKIGGRMRGAPVLLLTTIGRKSGRYRTTPVLYLQRDHDWVVVASNAGRSKNPAWYYNLRANPDAAIRIREQVMKVHAKEASAEERDRLWPVLVKMFSAYDGYRKKTNRRIPLIVLE